MNIIAFNGSPRKSWNTATLLNKALEGATSAGAETELIHLYDLIIREERKDDYLSVYRVVKTAFGGTE
ncbi:MAG: NAD(P)H-dependent oxidoreductase, partial [Candidatus Cloacimonetes bacterium]|nr:NAD(P)H-dependent oxidoreductase [Candidatus Cloacimonadota bacterium]